jgi:hypothetical protein
MRKIRLSIIVGLVLVSLAVLSGCKKEEKQPPPPIRNLPINLPPTAPTGSPAIAVRGAGTPAFTAEDVKQYVATHPIPMGVRQDAKPVISDVEFLTSKQISDRLHGENTGFPDDYPLCYVELQGPVSFAGPSGTRVTYNRGILVFDAHSGNLVMGGGVPQ